MSWLGCMVSCTSRPVDADAEDAVVKVENRSAEYLVQAELEERKGNFSSARSRVSQRAQSVFCEDHTQRRAPFRKERQRDRDGAHSVSRLLKDSRGGGFWSRWIVEAIWCSLQGGRAVSARVAAGSGQRDCTQQLRLPLFDEHE